jgi:hypothetical protein
MFDKWNKSSIITFWSHTHYYKLEHFTNRNHLKCKQANGKPGTY